MSFVIIFDLTLRRIAQESERPLFELALEVSAEARYCRRCTCERPSHWQIVSELDLLVRRLQWIGAELNATARSARGHVLLSWQGFGDATAVARIYSRGPSISLALHDLRCLFLDEWVTAVDAHRTLPSPGSWGDC